MSATTAKPQMGVLARIGAALARPHVTAYVCPTLITMDGLIAVARGYEVYWSPVAFDEDDGWDASTLCYRVYRQVSSREWSPSHGVELDSVFPHWAIKAECWIRNRSMMLRAVLRRWT